MPKKPRVQLPIAIFHIVTPGDGKQKRFHNDGHHQRLAEGLQAEVLRSGWRVIKYSIVDKPSTVVGIKQLSFRLPQVNRATA